MFSLTRNQCLKFAAAGAFFALTTAAPHVPNSCPKIQGRSGLMCPFSPTLALSVSWHGTSQTVMAVP
jgi:hypothetical protein